jgi:hypothetical protein
MELLFTNADGDDFNFSGNYILSPRWDGFGETPVDIQTTKAPYQHGRTYIDTIAEPKEMTVEFTITGSTRQNVFDRRKIVAERFNPRLGLGTLKWIQDDLTEYHIDCIPRGPDFMDGEGQSANHQVVIVSFIAPNPFWYDPTQIERIMVGFSGGLSLPFSLPFNLGTVGSQITVTNSGDIETPVMIYFYGEVENPSIENSTTEEEISITKTVQDGEILIINTAFGEKSVLLLTGGEYENAFEYVDDDSIFWSLDPGDNTVSYTVASEGANAECRLYYYNRYSGV